MNTPIHIESERFNEPISTRKGGGIILTIALSPYDVPKSVNGSFCVKRKKFVIEFNYLGGKDEKTRLEPVSDHIVAIVGEASRRIQFIELDVEELKVDEVKLVVKKRLTEAIRAYTPASEPNSRDSLLSRMNARVLEEVRDRCVERMLGNGLPLAL